jgi:SOS-response transcriptional repressor LexA
MHPIQKAILDLAERRNLANMTLKAVGREATGEVQSAQLVQYHLDKLLADGFLREDKKENVIERVSRDGALTGIVSLPLLGNASAGPATALAEENIQGYFQVSRRMVGNSPSTHFIIRAVGNSMNKADIGGLSIKDGDLIVVDGKSRHPNNGDYVLSVIDGYANVKRFHQDPKTKQVTLFSESTEKHPPIYIHPEDPISYFVAGKVKYVLKTPTVKWS